MFKDNRSSDPPVILSLVDTSKSTIRMLLEVWNALRHESHR
jgi:hypothetical protein